MPNCDRVKAVKTPTTYRWIREITFALKTQISSEARAASTMIPKVKTWTAQKSADVEEPAGKVARAISDTRETVSLGRACISTARYETPRNIEIDITPSTPRVVAALRPFGGRKAPTPFEIASTPVSATAPEANARTSTNAPTVAAPPIATGCGTSACGHVPATHLPMPAPTRTNIAATNE